MLSPQFLLIMIISNVLIFLHLPYAMVSLAMFATPRGAIYVLITILLLLSLFTESGLAKLAGIGFLLYAFALTASEGFACPKCWLGLISATAVLGIAFNVLSLNFYPFAFGLMWLDAFLHAS